MLIYSLPAFINRWLIRAFGVSFEVRGIENIRKDHGSVVIMNHQSLIDLSGKVRFCVSKTLLFHLIDSTSIRLSPFSISIHRYLLPKIYYKSGRNTALKWIPFFLYSDVVRLRFIWF